MDDSNIATIKNNISSNLSIINTNAFISKIKNASSVSECLLISNEFIESINEIRTNIISDISKELSNIKQTLEEKEISNNVLNNEISILFNNIKNLISQNKSKIKLISSNINDIFSGINLINSNLEKKKYLLASSRISKIISIKNNLLSNIKQLETNNQKILEEFSQDKNNKFNNSNNTVKVRPAPTPFPVTSYFNLEKNNKKRINTMSNSNLNNLESSKKKMINKRRRDFSFSLRENSMNSIRNSTMNNNTPLKPYSTINNFFKKNNENKKEDELNKKLLNQIKINDKLKKEIELLTEKINNAMINVEQTPFNNLRIWNNQNISTFKEKINIISDMLFSLTFLFNGLQNKNKTNNENEKEFSDIRKKLLDITTEISELKSILYQITLDNEDTNINNNNFQSLNTSDLIKSTNQSINFTEDFYTINDTINNTNNSKENPDIYLTEISSLKEKLRISEKKLIEVKNIYDSDIESRNLIENLLKKNLEENKATYEQKIMKYKKKYEEKEKEIVEIRKKNRRRRNEYIK